jgi:hypothetical protein
MVQQLDEGVHNPHREETEHERIDRNLSELIEELRVALPGIQVLFAFLLILPFNQRFVEVTEGQRTSTSASSCARPSRPPS